MTPVSTKLSLTSQTTFVQSGGSPDWREPSIKPRNISLAATTYRVQTFDHISETMVMRVPPTQTAMGTVPAMETEMELEPVPDSTTRNLNYNNGSHNGPPKRPFFLRVEHLVTNVQNTATYQVIPSLGATCLLKQQPISDGLQCGRMHMKRTTGVVHNPYQGHRQTAMQTRRKQTAQIRTNRTDQMEDIGLIAVQITKITPLLLLILLSPLLFAL